ncbi:MAG TPA: LysR family transcriptional regulator ArgP [Arthrobacter sp.]|nr:LysR family transcriptional regulator ArgP [Arthrobacter sp.]
MMEFNADHLRTLAAVIDHGGFESAADALHVTPSAVSQRVKALEQEVGRVLVLRVKPARTTEPGSILLRLARQMALLESEAVGQLGLEGSTDRPRVQLVINADSLSTWALPALAAMPGINFEITVDDQDYSTDSLRNGTAMAAITSDPNPIQGCLVRPLGIMRYRAAASPSFVERWLPDGLSDSALKNAPLLVFDRKDALQDRYLRKRLGSVPARPPRHYVPASSEFLRAAELGLGWGMLPDLQTESLVTAGSLVILDSARWIDVPLYWQQWSVESSTLALVAAALSEAAAAALR